MTQRPIRFGVSAFQGASRDDWVAKARLVEELGYSTLLVPDHLGEQIGPLTALAAAAVVTERIRLGTFVLDNDFRHPAVLAKEAATLDVLSDGRLELGIGAGWKGADYETSGIGFDPPPVRVARLEEAIAVLKGLWSEGPFTLHGEHYRITELDGHPKPVQRPHPPLFVGGGGPRMLSLAAREANIVGLLPRSKPDGSGLDVSDVLHGRLQRKVDVVRAAAGDRFEDLELNLLIQAVRVDDDAEAALANLADEWAMDADDVRSLPEVLVGTPAQMADKLLDLHARYGISYFTVIANVFEEFAEVMAEVRLRG